MKHLIINFILLFGLTDINAQTFELKKNKICPKIPTCHKNLCNEFFNFHGIHISSYYLIIDSINFRNSENNLNYILILSPISQEYGKDSLPCDRFRFAKRLLVYLNSGKEGFVVNYINENVIPKISEFQSEPLVNISPSKNGIDIELFTGSKIKCTYNFHFVNFYGEFYLEKMKYDCYLTDLSGNKKKSFKFKKTQSTKLRNIDLHKYLFESKL